MSERPQFVLKFEQTIDVIPSPFFLQGDRSGLEICEHKWPFGLLELSESGFEFLVRIRTNFCPEKHNKQIADSNLPIVFILKPGSGHSVKGILPSQQAKEDPLFNPIAIPAIDKYFEFPTIIF